MVMGLVQVDQDEDSFILNATQPEEGIKFHDGVPHMKAVAL